MRFTQKEGLKICQDLKLQKHLKWEMKRTRQELGSFCYQFDLSTKKPSCSGTCSKPKNYSSQKPPYKRSAHKYRQQFYSKPEQPYYKKPYNKFTKPHRSMVGEVVLEKYLIGGSDTKIYLWILKILFETALLHVTNPLAPKIVETDASDLGYGGILKQVQDNKEQILWYTSTHWNDCQKNYSTIKKKILSIILYITKFQSDLLNQKFLLRVDCKSAKEVLQKDVKKLVSKQIFARWQAILSIFYFDIVYIKGDSNFIPDFLTQEFLQNRS